MLKKKGIMMIVLTAVALTLTFGFAVKTNQILMRKASRDRMQDLIAGESNKDILFVGTSHVMNGIVPMELWNEYGYTSYILCAEYNDMDRNIAMIRLALQYTNPKLVVVDIDNYWEKSPEENTLAGYHEFADAFPLTLEKVRSTYDLYGNSEKTREILFPFLLYHNRWNDLSKNDLKAGNRSQILKGYEFATDTQMVEVYDPVPRSEGELPDVYGVAALEQLVEECSDRGIEVMFMTIPFAADTTEQKYLQGIHGLAERSRISYVNMLETPDLVNANTDFRDEGHLNLSGAVKVTGYIGDYIKTNYQIPDRREEEGCRREWNDNYAEYKEFELEQIAQRDDLKSVLVLCSDDNFRYSVLVKKDSPALQDPQTAFLLENMDSYNNGKSLELDGEVFLQFGEGESDMGIVESYEPGDIYITVYDKEEQTPLCEKVFKSEIKNSLEIELCDKVEE